jgi:alcohol-forming fatty acyl-CoA reductase
MMNHFQVFNNLTDDDKAKVRPIVGELSEPDFAIKTETYKTLINEVNIVYHVAATIRFNEFLGTAIKTNLIGTQVAVNFAKKLQHLSAFIYVSTAYCNSCYFQEGIEEKVYPSHHDPYDMIKLIDNNNNFMEELPKTGTDELKKIIGIHPNTYTFTKQLAENLINREMKNLPVGIMRPSIVYGTHRDPHQGWIGSANNGHIGFMTAATKGFLMCLGGDPESVMDLIPCDYVVNSAIVLSWYVGTRKIETPEVIHCTSGEIKPLTFGKYCTLLNRAIKRHPCDFSFFQPHVKVRNGLRYSLYTWIFLYLPAFITYFPEKFFPMDKKRDKR